MEKEQARAAIKSNFMLCEMQARLLKSMAHPTRLMILHFLEGGEKTTTELMEIVGVSNSNLSQHLALLRQQKIITARRDGMVVYYQIASPKIIHLCRLIREIINEQMKKAHAQQGSDRTA
jgi:ArsR family transcriptional regulator